MNRLLFICVPLLMLCASCSNQLMRKSVHIDTAENATISFNNNSNYRIENVNSRVYVGRRPKYDVQVKKDGYKTTYDIMYPDKPNPSLIAAAGLTGGLTALFSRDSDVSSALTASLLIGTIPIWDYKPQSKPVWSYPLVKLPDLEYTAREIKLVRLNMQDMEATESSVSSPQLLANIEALPKDEMDERTLYLLKEEQGAIYSRMNEKIIGYGGYDTTYVSYNRHRDLSLSVEVREVNWYNYRVKKGAEPNGNHAIVRANYLIKDSNGEIILEEEYTTASGHFWQSVLDHYVISDAIEYGIIEAIKQPEVMDLIDTKPKRPAAEMVSQVRVDSGYQGQMIAKENLIKNTVFFKYRDEMVAALPVSKDGIVAVPKSATTFENDLVIVDQDGKEHQATPLFDLSLSELSFLKTDMTFDEVTKINLDPLETGQSLHFIGVESYFNLVTSTNGIVSSLRNKNEAPTYQTDAEINHLRWPFVLDDSGTIRGVVSRNFNSSRITSMAFFPALRLD